MAATPTFVTPVEPALRRPSLVGAVACGACLLAGAVYVAAIDPADSGGLLLPCPFRATTGLWCPGCGLTRATHHLLRGELTTALGFNVLAPIVLLAIAISWLGWLAAARGSTDAWPVRAVSRIPTWAYVAAGGVALAFAVVRNLPGVSGLRG